MKRTALLNRHLSRLVSELGHLDEIVVGDAGLPVPKDVPVIDLAVTAGVPTLWQVLEAIRSELVIEAAVTAKEADADLDQAFQKLLDGWSMDTGQAIVRDVISHAAFKERSMQAKAVIRTGEVTPYANIILISGVAF